MTTISRLTAIILSYWIAFHSYASARDKHPLSDEGQVTYEFILTNQTVGHERVLFSDEGWSVEGRFERGRTRREYSASWLRTGEDMGEWHVSGTRGSMHCTWNGDSIAIIEGEPDQPKAIADWDDDSTPLFYENLVWTVYSEMAARLFANEVPAPGTIVSFLDPRADRKVEATIVSVKTRQLQRPETDSQTELRDIVLMLGDLEIHASFTGSGLLVYLEVPSQQIQVICNGYETAASEAKTMLHYGPWRALLSQPNHEFTLRGGVRAPMRDGVELVADIFIPKGEGPWPTILVRTPYGRAKPSRTQGEFWAKRGFAFVAQDVRGCFESEGEWVPALHEKNDGSDTIDWIADQDWSDGNVGMIGGSYAGWVQLLAAVSGNLHLKAIVPQVAPPDPLEAFPYEGGAFQLGVAWWAMVVDHQASGNSGPPPTHPWQEVMSTLPLSDLDEALGIKQGVLDEWLSHPPSDSAYWNQRSYQQDLDKTDVAALHITGWYDGDLPGALQNYPILREQAKSEKSRSGQFLIVGPWGHAFNQTRRIGDVDFGPDARVDLDAVYVRFFDHYLKGIENGIEVEQPVNTFVMGRNQWRTDDTWPLTQTRFAKLFLGSDGDANSRSGSGRLALVPSNATAEDTFVYDPNDPAPTPEVQFDDPLKNSRLMDLSNTVDRPDVLDYTTDRLSESVTIVGPVELNVWIKTDAADTDVCAKLLRIEPDGTTRRITGGLQRVRYRNGPGTDAPVEPGTKVMVTVQLRSTGITLNPGDRLRLEVSSSEFPSFDRNPNTLEHASGPEQLRVATTHVLHDPEHRSHLLVPVVPNEKDQFEIRFEREEE